MRKRRLHAVGSEACPCSSGYQSTLRLHNIAQHYVLKNACLIGNSSKTARKNAPEWSLLFVRFNPFKEQAKSSGANHVLSIHCLGAGCIHSPDCKSGRFPIGRLPDGSIRHGDDHRRARSAFWTRSRKNSNRKPWSFPFQRPSSMTCLSIQSLWC